MFGGHLVQPNQPGRNDPCWCGSGKKYKKCHLDSDAEGLREARAALPEAMTKFAENAARQERIERTLREQYGIFVNYVAPAQYQGRKVWAIGSRLYTDNPPNQTFSEFLVAVLAGTFGETWLTAQNAFPPEEQHFVRRAYTDYAHWQRRESEGRPPDADGLWSATPDGWTTYLISLAFDIASLIHTASLPEPLLNRLRNRDQYQGARYEIAVAAIFARLGCEIEWIDDRQASDQKHPEFYARRDAITLAVEAKSRHRQGVIHAPGERLDEKALRGDVQGLYKSALEKEVGDMPFIIFIDLNAPPSPGTIGFETKWAQDIRKWLPLEDDGAGSYRSLCFTNFSPHYQGTDVAVAAEYTFVENPRTRDQLPEAFRDALLTALTAYGRVPELTETGDLRE
jgi:hypothetical protein